MIEHRSPISGIDATGGRYVATAGYDSQVILWDATAARRTALHRACHDHLANQCRFAPGGDRLVTASSDYTARIWKVPELQLEAVLGGHDDDVEMAAFSPDGQRVATASRDYRVRVFDLEGRLQWTGEGHTADVLSVEWTADGSELVTSGDDGTVRRWSAGSGELLETIDLGGVETDTLALVDGGRIVVGNDDGELVSIGHGDRASLTAHEAGVKRLAVSEDRRLLVSASYDRSIKLWRVLGDGTLELQATTEAPAAVWLRSVALLDEHRLLCGTFGSSYALYDASADEWCLEGVDDTPGVNAVRAVAGRVYTVGDAGVVRRDGVEFARPGSLCNFLVPVGDRVLTGGQLGELFDATTGEVLHRHRSPLNCGVPFERDGKPHVMIGCYTGEGLVFCAEPGELVLVATVLLDDNAVKSLAADPTTIFGVTATGAAVWVGIDRLQRERHLPDAHDRIANGAACLGSGVFASVSRDRKLRIWSEDGTRTLATPHRRSVKCVAACQESGLIATGSYDGEVAIVDHQGASWSVHRPTAFGISSIALGLEPGSFLASSYDGLVYVVERDGWRRQG